VDFTREPIIETIITPMEGCKLVIRNSKVAGQEEYLVDAIEMIAFGHTLFFRSLERPKAFLVPVSDYEILEVREARMVLKNANLDRSIKIGSGREQGIKNSHREIEKEEPVSVELGESSIDKKEPSELQVEARLDKKRDRRRNYRKRRDKEETASETANSSEEEKIEIDSTVEKVEQLSLSPQVLSLLLQPPPTLISETIKNYRQNEQFKGAFFLTEDEQYKPHDKVQTLLQEDEEEENIPTLQKPIFEAESVETEIISELVGNVEMDDLASEEQNSFFGEEQQMEPIVEEKEEEMALPLYAEDGHLDLEKPLPEEETVN
jgi:hypothetical protein